MGLKNIFKKPVDRRIEGVIKADDEASIKLEIEEYVLTKEVEKRLYDFLTAYNNYENANGVWISGFFGSGKSHLLKILSLLLENREIEGEKAVDLFIDKCGSNEILRADIKRAVSIPSQSILFNIDQKADVISKTQTDALLSVFVKVFDDMCGYYGKQGHIAKFERDLDNRNLYSKFKDEYKKVANLDWHIGREQALLEAGNIAKAYSNAAGVDFSVADGILDKYRSEYKVSIEDFAEQVNTYIQGKEKNFRLNFFVDEVGQFIADNTKLMTNLQTVAESLATKCKGRAWVIVTAQEDMNTVVGEMDKQQSNDFSKIQARFDNRMKLTSQDVAEVIQKRLLLKNDESIEALSDIYQAQYNNFKTLFDFEDGSQRYRNFVDREHFIHSYPFIPYQFTLFQKAIENLSKHNAFEGKHSSVGERSMLGVFQHVIIHIADNELGQLATFDLMFEGINTALKANIQRSILVASNNLDNKFAVQLLKVLFLVKYIHEFKSTIRNLCVLMYSHFESDLPELRKKVEEALNLLEQETYIQRNGNVYEFLTDEEKDIEEEIKNTEIETSLLTDELSKMIFDRIIVDRKIRYAEYKQDYAFTKKLDDKNFSREQELAIHIISPFHEHSGNEQVLIMQAMGRDELRVILPPDDRLITDLKLYKQTDKYIKQTTSANQQESRKRILTDKTFQNQQRYNELQVHLRELLSTAKLLVAGNELEIAGEDPRSRITTAFYELIRRVYPNLRMLRGTIYNEKEVPKFLKPKDELFNSLEETEQELINYVTGNNRNGVRITLKTLIEHFEKKPYGWPHPAVICNIAKICGKGKVEARADGNILEDSDLEMALINTAYQANTVLTPQIDFSPSQIRRLKDFFGEFFDAPTHSNEARSLGKECSLAFESMYKDLEKLKSQIGKYAFSNALDNTCALLKELSKKQYIYFLIDLPKQEDDLFDQKEDIIDPLRKFINGPQKIICDNAIRFMHNNDANFRYVDDDSVQKIRAILEDVNGYKGNQMQQLKVLMDKLKTDIEEKLQEEREKAISKINNRLKQLNDMEEFKTLLPEQQEHLEKPFHATINDLNSQTLIAMIRDIVSSFEDEKFRKILSEMSSYAAKQAKPVIAEKKTDPKHIEKNIPNQTTNLTKDKAKPVTNKVEKRAEYISGKSLTISYDKPWLEDEADVDSYLKSYKKSLMKEIKSGKRVQV